MVVPEAAVDEDDGLDPREDDVGATSEVAAVESVAEARSVNGAADDHLGLGVLAADRRHDATADGGDSAFRQRSSRVV